MGAKGTRPIRWLGIAGSLRSGSYNAGLIAAAGEALPPGVALEVYDRLGALPPFNQDAEEGGGPEPVRHLRERIAAADALLIASPEYNASIPGVLKNAIDWASRDRALCDGKPVAILGASPGSLGTARCQAHLRAVCAYLNMLPLGKPEVFVAHAPGKFDASGRLTDEETRDRVGQLVAALAEWTRVILAGRAATDPGPG